MKKYILTALLVISNMAIAQAKIEIAKVNDRAQAREHVTESTAFSDKVKVEIKTELDKTKKDSTKYVALSRLSDGSKASVATYIDSTFKESGKNLRVSHEALAEAVAKRADILADITLLIAQGDKQNLKLIADFSNRDQTEIAALVKTMRISKEDGNSLQARAKQALESLSKDSSQNIRDVLKAVGFKDSSKLEDFIIC